MEANKTVAPRADDDVPRNTAELQAHLMAERFIKSRHMEQQPDGSITAVDPDDALTTEAEKDAFFAQIAAEEKRKLDVHDDLVRALQKLEMAASFAAIPDPRERIDMDEALEKARDILSRVGAA